MKYVSQGRVLDMDVTSLRATLAPRSMAAARSPQRAAAQERRVTELVRCLRATRTFRGRFHSLTEDLSIVRAPGPAHPGVVTIATETVIVGGAGPGDLKWARDQYGARLIAEGSEGKVLLRLPEAGREGVRAAFDLALKLHRHGEIGAAHPNFLRVLPHLVRAGSTPRSHAWGHRKIGVARAWKTTRGRASVVVAILDEGVDARHPGLRPGIVAERDFIGSRGNSSRPDNDDAHGTACAGIVGCRRGWKGVAPGVSLIGVRIAMDDGTGDWVFDDFATADAIDWCWREGAHVLSSSWGGGPPSDEITRAFDRARTLGRGGLGAVVVVAAGNHQGRVDYPANLPGVLAVGASNQYDERKTRTSRDGENWGSAYGPELALLAPGVEIPAADIVGRRGYDPGDYVLDFNGTSAATPHVAGAAALVLSVAPQLTESQVRRLLEQTADKLPGQRGWTRELGHGRLNVARAVTAARQLAAAPPGP